MRRFSLRPIAPGAEGKGQREGQRRGGKFKFELPSNSMGIGEERERSGKGRSVGRGLFRGRKVVPLVVSQSIEYREDRLPQLSLFSYLIAKFLIKVLFICKRIFPNLLDSLIEEPTPCFRVFFTLRQSWKEEDKKSVEIQFTSLLWLPALRRRMLLRAQPSRTSGHFRFPRDKKERVGLHRMSVNRPPTHLL